MRPTLTARIVMQISRKSTRQTYTDIDHQLCYSYLFISRICNTQYFVAHGLNFGTRFVDGIATRVVNLIRECQKHINGYILGTRRKLNDSTPAD